MVLDQHFVVTSKVMLERPDAQGRVIGLVPSAGSPGEVVERQNPSRLQFSVGIDRIGIDLSSMMVAIDVDEVILAPYVAGKELI